MTPMGVKEENMGKPGNRKFKCTRSRISCLYGDKIRTPRVKVHAVGRVGTIPVFKLLILHFATEKTTGSI